MKKICLFVTLVFIVTTLFGCSNKDSHSSITSSKSIPKAEVSSGLTEVNLKSFIEKDHEVCYTAKYSDNIVAIVSAKTKSGDFKQYGNVVDLTYLADIRVDLFNIADDKQIGKGHLLKSVIDKGYFPYYVDSHYADSKTGELDFKFGLIPKDDRIEGIDKVAYCVITIGNNYEMKDTVALISDGEFEKSKIALQYDKVVSKSGRYETFYRNYDLFVHDNTTGKDVLVFDAKPDDNKDDAESSVYKTASACSFEGDVLYYNVIGYEWIIGNGSYNMNSKVNKLNKNEFAIDWVSNGYAYCYTSDESDDYYYGRFNLSQPEKVEKFFGGFDFASATYAYSDTNKLIAQIRQIYQDEGNSSDKDTTSLITLYNIGTFKKVAEYSLKSPALENGMFMGDYLYITSGDYHNAYKIKLK